MFIGKSLTNIRMLYGLTRGQLAKEIGVTEQAVWQYENGYTSPKMEVINGLKRLFHVKASYFYSPDLLSDERDGNIEGQYIAYRSETINSSAKTQSETAHIRFIDCFLKKAESKISYPPNQLVSLRNEMIAYMQTNPGMARAEWISYAARTARKRLGLPADSNKGLLFLLEKAGAFVVEKEIGDTIDAYSLWTDDERPYIVLGTIKKSAVRRNFDLAHELGHLLLHYKVEFSMQDRKSYRELEDEANSFASEFLLPEAFLADCRRVVKVSNLDAYVDIKEKWDVSLQAIAMRVHEAGLMEYQQYRYFFMSLSRKQYKVCEPLDDKIPVVPPSKVRSLLQLLFEKDLYSVAGLLEELHVDVRFLTYLTGIEAAFFERFMPQEQKVFTMNELIYKK